VSDFTSGDLIWIGYAQAGPNRIALHAFTSQRAAELWLTYSTSRPEDDLLSPAELLGVTLSIEPLRVRS